MDLDSTWNNLFFLTEAASTPLSQLFPSRIHPPHCLDSAALSHVENPDQGVIPQKN